MAQATSDPPEVKVCSSRMVSPAQTSAQFLCLNMSMASSSTGKRKTEPHRVGRRKSILEMAGPVSILLAVGRAFSSPHWALSAACLDPHPRGNARGVHSVSLSVTLCGFTVPFCEPLTSPSFGYFLPWLLIVSLHFCWNISSLRCAKPIIICLLVHASAEPPARGATTKTCLFASCFLFILNIFFPPLLLPLHNKISSCAQKASLAILTTLTTCSPIYPFLWASKGWTFLKHVFPFHARRSLL